MKIEKRMYCVSIKECIAFIVIFIVSRLLIILLNIRRRRTALPINLLSTKRGCVRTMIVLGSGTMKTLISLMKYPYCLDPATATFVNHVAFLPILTSKQPISSSHLFVHCKLDYCDSLYFNSAYKTQINRIQHIQNSLAHWHL